jgi:transcriptional regulator with XRE-family HTH domain
MSAAEQHQAQKIEMKTSTIRAPYHYAGSGLPNVYLVGVTYQVRADGMQSAAIACLPALMEALAKALVEKRAPLTADELRFLRKRLRYASKDFATLLGLSAEQYSRLENEAVPIQPMLDRMVRLLYAALAKLQPDVAEGVARVQWQAEVNREQKIIATQDDEQRWIVTTKAA